VSGQRPGKRPVLKCPGHKRKRERSKSVKELAAYDRKNGAIRQNKQKKGKKNGYEPASKMENWEIKGRRERA